MAKLDTGPLKAIKRVVKSTVNLKFKEMLGYDIQSPDGSPCLEDEDPLEQFYSDEDPSGNKEDQVEDIPIVIKKMNKRVTNVMKSLKTATKKMDKNHEILKRSIREGLKPSSLKGKMHLVGQEFEKDLEIEL
jgi:hypothetical protein